jgi:hypothetical protein
MELTCFPIFIFLKYRSFVKLYIWTFITLRTFSLKVKRLFMFRNQYDQVIRTLQEHMKMLNRLFEGCTDVESTGTFASDRMCVYFMNAVLILLPSY